MSGGGGLRIPRGELTRHPGVRRAVEGVAEVGGLGVADTVVPPPGVVTLDLEAEAVGGGAVVEGSLEAVWTGVCRRCLEPVEGVARAEVREVFEEHPTEGETYPLGADEVDLTPMVRDAVLLALPLAPLCGDDCRGPAPDAFPTGQAEALDQDEGASPPETRDPRWAALDQLRLEE